MEVDLAAQMRVREQDARERLRDRADLEQCVLVDLRTFVPPRHEGPVRAGEDSNRDRIVPARAGPLEQRLVLTAGDHDETLRRAFGYGPRPCRRP